MQLRSVDPRILIDNPNNPRRTAAHAAHDQQLAASIRDSNGPLQPPTVREQPDGTLTIIYGHRRKYASIAAGLPEIHVLVRGANETGDGMAAFAENMVRTGMCSVDIWRAIEGLVGQGYTEDGIGTALSIPVRTIRKLRLFASVLPAMLDRMAQGDEPNERELRTIASATRDEQTAAWKKNKPKKTETTSWNMIAHALTRRRISASVAKFDDAFAATFGLVWMDDLFAEGGTDPRFTDQVELFMAAQQAWLEGNLPPRGQMLETNSYGDGELPPKAQQAWHGDRKRKGVQVGVWVCGRTGEVKEKLFEMPEKVGKSALGGHKDRTQPKSSRPHISGKGDELVGTYRTEALRQALAEGEISDDQLLGLLVLALSGKNVSVQQDHRTYHPGSGAGSRRDMFARSISDGGMLTGDRDTLRAAARGILGAVLSCNLGQDGSGDVARIAGVSIHADVYLPNMATDDFLTKLSKDGITAAVQEQGVLPRNTGKEMRAALKEHVGTGSYVHPAALFALSAADLTTLAERRAADATPDEDEPSTAPSEEAGDDRFDLDDAPEDDDPDSDVDPDLIVPPGHDLPEQHAAA